MRRRALEAQERVLGKFRGVLKGQEGGWGSEIAFLGLEDEAGDFPPPSCRASERLGDAEARERVRKQKRAPQYR